MQKPIVGLLNINVGCVVFQHLEKMEKLATEGLSTLTGELAGTYYPLRGMDKATQDKMIEDHFLFRADDA